MTAGPLRRRHPTPTWPTAPSSQRRSTPPGLSPSCPSSCCCEPALGPQHIVGEPDLTRGKPELALAPLVRPRHVLVWSARAELRHRPMHGGQQLKTERRLEARDEVRNARKPFARLDIALEEGLRVIDRAGHQLELLLRVIASVRVTGDEMPF